MSKFGAIINSEIPVIICFYNYINEENEIQISNFLKEIAGKLGAKASVVKIEIEKNAELINALNIKDNPTFVIYKNSELKWRHGGAEEIENLITIVEQLV